MSGLGHVQSPRTLRTLHSCEHRLPLRGWSGVPGAGRTVTCWRRRYFCCVMPQPCPALQICSPSPSAFSKYSSQAAVDVRGGWEPGWLVEGLISPGKVVNVS